MFLLSPLLALAIASSAREITFPPVYGAQHRLGAQQINEDLDVSGAAYWGLSTYANLPYVHCLAKANEDVEKYDIAILGAPFDTVSARQCSLRLFRTS